jgi:hypothetical protein
MGKPDGKGHWEDLGVGGGYIKIGLTEECWGMCSGLIWLRIVTGGGIL